MSDPTPGQPPDVPFGDLFNDVPLFREIQRVLMAGTGPVNWELARQVAIAMASWGKDDPTPSEEDRLGLEDTVRAAELHVAELTGLQPPSDVAAVLAFRRAQWVEATIEGVRDLVQPAATRLGEAFAKAQTDDAPPETAQASQDVLAQLSPLLLGAQAGSVLGSLGQRALGQFDVPVPRTGPPRLFFVVPNIASFERDWSLQPVEFRAWVSLHEVLHRFEFARSWTHDHLRSVVVDFVSTLEIDVAGLRQQLERLDPSDPEALQGMFQSEEGLFGTVLDPEQRLKLGRIQAFLAAAEGYGEHVTEVLGRRMLRSYGQIVEAAGRRREEVDSSLLFERLLGMEVTSEQYAAGKRFCDTVVDRTDEHTLARMWDSAESLPSLPEIEEPTLWLSRIA